MAIVFIAVETTLSPELIGQQIWNSNLPITALASTYDPKVISDWASDKKYEEKKEPDDDWYCIAYSEKG